MPTVQYIEEEKERRKIMHTEGQIVPTWNKFVFHTPGRRIVNNRHENNRKQEWTRKQQTRSSPTSKGERVVGKYNDIVVSEVSSTSASLYWRTGSAMVCLITRFYEQDKWKYKFNAKIGSTWHYNKSFQIDVMENIIIRHKQIKRKI